MTDAPVLWAPAEQAPPARPQWFPIADLKAGAVIVAVLAAAGAVLGIVWQWWSPPGPLGFVLPGHLVQPDETEAFVAADGRYAVITGVVGLVAAVALWRLKRVRGPVAALALGVGGLAGAWLTEIVGRALDGGRTDGPVNTLLPHLRLSVHMHGLRILEPLTAMLCYSLCVAFAADDDLGRGDSVGRGGQPERGWGDSHAAGALQQP